MAFTFHIFPHWKTLKRKRFSEVFYNITSSDRFIWKLPKVWNSLSPSAVFDVIAHSRSWRVRDDVLAVIYSSGDCLLCPELSKDGRFNIWCLRRMWMLMDGFLQVWPVSMQLHSKSRQPHSSSKLRSFLVTFVSKAAALGKLDGVCKWETRGFTLFSMCRGVFMS